MTIPDIRGEAETLIRALRGVAHVRIEASDRGIEHVHVTATDDRAAHDLAAHVRSALLAGLSAPVLAGRIHVRAPGEDTTGEPEARARLRLIQDDRPASHAAEDTRADGAGPDAHPPETPAETAVRTSDATPPLTQRPRLVAVDADRPGDGRVLCRVAVAYRTRVHRAEAVAVDLPGAAAQAAAQATVRALIDAGIPGIELSGLREVEIAGRDYVLVALRRTEPYPRHRSGSAPIIGSPERSAAEATVAAANEMI